MTTTSAARSCLWLRTKSSRWTLPTSSSPSMKNLMLTGRLPAFLMYASIGLDVHEHLALVVGRAARVDLAVANRGLERRRGPEIERIDRLHVVVAVEEDRRLAWSAEPVAVDDRIAWRVDQRDVLHAGGTKRVGGPLGRAPHVGRVLRQRADARNREVLLQLVDVAIAIDVDEVDDLVHGSMICHASPVRRGTTVALELQRGARARLFRARHKRLWPVPDRRARRWRPARVVAVAKRVEDLLLALAPVRDVGAKQRDRLRDDRTVRGKHPRRVQRDDALERREVGGQVAAQRSTGSTPSCLQSPDRRQRASASLHARSTGDRAHDRACARPSRSHRRSSTRSPSASGCHATGHVGRARATASSGTVTEGKRAASAITPDA